MKTEKVTFKNLEGKELSARLELPINGKASAFAIFAHCFTCNKNFHAATQISRALALNQIGVLRFDFTGLGESEGEFSDTNFSSNIADIVSAATFLADHYASPQILIGHSLGGTAALIAAEKIASVKAVATIGAPADPEHVITHLTESVENINKNGRALVKFGDQPFLIKKQFLEDLNKANIQEIYSNWKKALLVLHSPADKVVAISNAEKIFTAVSHPKSFISLDNADHFLSEKTTGIYIGNLIATWAEKYISLKAPAKLITDKEVVTKTGNASFVTEIKAAKHTLFADEPLSAGGTDLGPDPYAFLNAALGACTGMTLQMYAQKKAWQLDAVKVHLSHQKSYPEDCEKCKDEQSKIDHIDRIIELSGDLSEKQRKRLLEIAEKCPVHKTLSSEIRINSSLKD